MKKIALVLSLILISSSLVLSQSKKEKKRMKQEKAKKEFLETKAIIESGKMKFRFEWAVSQKGVRVTLTGRGDSMVIDTTTMTGAADLPYFGAVQVPSIGGDGGIKFSGEITDYSVKYKDKKNKAFIKFKAKSSSSEIFTVNINVIGSGSCNMGITSSQRNRISYTGSMSGFE